MAHRLFRWLGLLALPAQIFLSCAMAAEAPPPEPRSGLRTGLRLVAATTLAPLADELVGALRKRGAHLQMNVAGGESALESLANNEADVVLLARALDAAEAARFNSRVIGHDSLLLVVHERNPLENISEAMVRAIFSRELSDWQQVGAGNNGAIVPVRRGLASGTRKVIDQAFAIGNVVPAGIVELGSNLATVLYVAADPQAIGYVSAGTYDQARQRGLRIKALRMGGLTPNAQFCTSGSYRLCRPLLLVWNKRIAAADLKPLSSALSGAGAEDLLVRHGFAPPAVPQ